MPVKVPSKYRGWVRSAAAGTGLPYSVVAAQIYTESGFQPGVTSPAGAEGIAQFLPGTYSEYGPEPGSPFNVADAKTAYIAFMKNLLAASNGDVRKALASYNAGPANWKAGLGYADHILGLAGAAGDLTAGEASRGSLDDPKYRNPFRQVTGLQPERIDQGVDYAGTGPVFALGPGVISQAATGNTGWGPPEGAAPGGYIQERLTQGPLSGHYVYIAEGISPNVKAGQKVTSKTQIGTMSAPIETGFAEGPGTTQALAHSEFTGDNTTAIGAGFSKVLESTGAPGGTTSSGGVQGSTPSWLKDILNGITGAAGGVAGGAASTGGGLGGIATAIGSVGDSLGEIGDAVEWLVNPTNEMRIMAGVGGGLMLLLGLYTMTKVGGQPVAFGVSIPFALPMSIILTGGGALLLFVAFHGIQGDSFWGAISQALHSGQLSAASAGGA